MRTRWSAVRRHSHRRYPSLEISFTICAMGIALLTHAAAVAAQPPDPGQCDIDPWDAYGLALMSPGTQSGLDLVTITVRMADGSPIPDAGVYVVLDGCNELCVDQPNGLSGTTDANGAVTLDPAVGGCTSCTVRIVVETDQAYEIRNFGEVHSPDVTGYCRIDGRVDDLDIQYFFDYLLVTGDQCGDLDGDGEVGLIDLVIFQQAQLAGDANAHQCGADPNTSQILPWDDYGHALVVPGVDTPSDSVTIHLRFEDGSPVADEAVEIRIEDCAGLCIDQPAGLSGTTDANGDLVLNPSLGGCCVGSIQVVVCGVALRTYTEVRSPDWNGCCADGVVDASDRNWFDAHAGGPYEACADYNGDGVVDQDDEAIIAASDGAANVNHSCAPDETASSVEGTGTTGQQLLVSPGTQSGIDALTIHVRTASGTPVVDAPVAIEFPGCEGLCIDEPAGLTGRTDANGDVVLDPRVSGCDDCTVLVYACCVPIYQGARVVSPDWNGLFADGRVDSVDVAYCMSQFPPQGQDPCCDFTGDGEVSLADLNLQNLALGDQNSNWPCVGSAGVDTPVRMPSRLVLSPLGPNPTHRRLAYRLQMPADGTVRVKVYDALGRLVATPFDGPLNAGTHELAWDPAGARNERLASGVYYFRVETGDQFDTLRFVLLR